MTTSNTTPYDYSALTATKQSASTKSATTTASTQSLSQTDFLNLITTQMENQDPSHPTSSADMVTEMSQFGTLSGMQSLQASFASFASSMTDSQTLQATSLVGHQVISTGSQGALASGGSITGNIDIPASASDVAIQITDSTGAVVNTVDLGAQQPGTTPFTWDGTNSTGGTANPGLYNIKAMANIGGTNTAMTTGIASTVSSVSVGANGSGVTVNLAGGLPSISLNNITQVL